MSQTSKGRATTSRKGGASTKKPRLEEEETKRLYALGNKENLQTTNIVGLAALDVQQAKLNVLPRFYEEVEVTALQEDDTHSHLKELGARLDSLAEEHNSLQKRVVVLEKDNKYLKEENDSLKGRVVVLEKDNKYLKEENDSLKGRVVVLEKDNKYLKEENDSLKGDVLVLEKDNKYLKEENDSLKGRVLVLEKDNTRLNERVANLERHRQEIINTATQSTPTRGH